MIKKYWIIPVLLFVAVAVGVWLTHNSRIADWFIKYPLPLDVADRFFDIGIVDANNDDLLDIYTTNHHFRQALLLADGNGGYTDAVGEWGLDQSRDFPLAELSFTAPAINSPGLYIYWQSTQFVITARGIEDPDSWRGSFRVNDPVEIVRNDGFRIQKQDQATRVSETTIDFVPAADGQLRTRPGGQGLPITFQLADDIPLDKVYVGLGKVSPRSNVFTLAMRDRHAMAWADYNNDGWLDIFINRGGLGGMLNAYPDAIKRHLNDELLISHNTARYSDIVTETGIRKNSCSGRHARWLDFNSDGLLDLFVNCYDRGNAPGVYSKQLYRQDANGILHDVARESGLAIPGQQIGSLAWFDVDGDGDVDLVAFQDEGFFLYQNDGGRFSRVPVSHRSLNGAMPIGSTTKNEWFYDGKVSVSDYDADGDIDLFSASKRGNMLLVNDAGKLRAISPDKAGLPKSSIEANWVDYDNDGLTDLHLVPQGIFRQTANHSFEPTGLLKFPDEEFIASVTNWFDMDNDGRIDLVMALSENPDFHRWWEFSKEPTPSITWVLKAYRNIGPAKHWLQVKLVGKDGNRQAIGARVTVTTPEGVQAEEVGNNEGAFFSQGHYRLYYGLGDHTKVDMLRIRWPNGDQQELHDVDGDRLVTIERASATQPD